MKDAINIFTSKEIQEVIHETKQSIEREISEAWEKYQEDYSAEYYDMYIPELGETLTNLTGYKVLGCGISRITFDLGDKVLKLEVTDQIEQNRNEVNLYKEYEAILPHMYYISEDCTIAIFEKLRILTKEDYNNETLLRNSKVFILNLLQNNCSFWEIMSYQNGYLGLNSQGKIVLADAGTFSKDKVLRSDFQEYKKKLESELQKVKGW